jgi:hypothetical protein
MRTWRAARRGVPGGAPACALAIVAIAGLAGSALAHTYVSGGALSVDGPYTGPAGNNFNRELYSDASELGTSRGTTAVTDPSGSGPLADSGAEAAHGLVRARAYTTLARAGVYQGGASTEAGFSDELVFSAPGRAGQAGTVTFGIEIDGTLSSTSTQPGAVLWGHSEASVDFSAESGVDRQEVEIDSYSSSQDGAGERIAEPLTLTLGIVFGAPVEVDFSLDLTSNVWGNSSPSAVGTFAATGIADFRHTAAWAGILDLRDASGAPVETFDVTSASGTDYRGAIAVPEPAGCILLGVGLAVHLAARARRAA